MPAISVAILRHVVLNLLGEDVLPLAEHLKTNGEVSEFELSKCLKEDINTIRNKLYRLQQQNLIGFTKKKDEEKGWYIYFWHLKPDSFNYLYRKLLGIELDKLAAAISKKSCEALYQCPEGCSKLNCEEALLLNFTCPDCGGVLTEQDLSKELTQLKKQKARVTKSMDKLA
jgi:transcription initiation factor TFIIE subunit alpha